MVVDRVSDDLRVFLFSRFIFDILLFENVGKSGVIMWFDLCFDLRYFHCCDMIVISGKEVNMTPSEIITSISLLVASLAALIKAATGLIKEMRRKPKRQK